MLQKYTNFKHTMFAIYGLRFAICDLRFTVCDLRFAIYGLRFTVYGLRIAKTIKGRRFLLALNC